jgi:PIN domain nuclease of toxin-antitoxin system
MKWLLDTHALVWLVEAARELSPRARKAIDAAASVDGLAVSAITFWEVAMLRERGKLALTATPADWRRRVLALPGIIEAPITGEIGVEAAELPGELHGDPADRLIVATARIQGWRLATHDRRLLAYGAQGHVHVAAV